MCGSVSSSVCVTFNGEVNVGGTGCFVAGISLRVRGVCHDCCCCCCWLCWWLCCCWGSLYWARGSARNGVSGFGFVGVGCVVRPALNMGRRVRPLKTDRESILGYGFNAGFLVLLESTGKDFMAQVAAWAAAVTCRSVYQVTCPPSGIDFFSAALGTKNNQHSNQKVNMVSSCLGPVRLG